MSRHTTALCSLAAALATLLLQSPAARADVLFTDIALVEDTDGAINGAIAGPNFYLAAASCKFYQTHADIYDVVFVFTSIPQNFLTNVQQGWPVQYDQQGIGRDGGGLLGDQTQTFCSWNRRLRQAVKMGDIAILPDNPDARYTGIPFYALSGIELVGHEFGHHWLAAITFDRGDGQGKHCLLRGMETQSPEAGECDGLVETAFNQHWSYFFNSRSLMYGSFIEDNHDGTFTAWYDHPTYSHLDQYLMGLRAPEEVEQELFIVDSGDPISGSGSVPMQPGNTVTWTGTRLSFTMDDVVRSMGPRVPARQECHWKAAFMIIYALGLPPTPEQIAKVTLYANRWEEFYSQATDGRGSMDCTIDGRGTGTAGCAGLPSTVDGDQDLVSEKEDMADLAEDPEELPGCTSGVIECHEQMLVKCVNDMWGLLEDCSVAGEVCVGGACVAAADGDDDPVAETSTENDNDVVAVCAPGARRCNGAWTVEVCNAQGSAWGVYTVCSPRVCVDGACADAPGDSDEDGSGIVGKKGGCAGMPPMSLLALAAVLLLKRRRGVCQAASK